MSLLHWNEIRIAYEFAFSIKRLTLSVTGEWQNSVPYTLIDKTRAANITAIRMFVRRETACSLNYACAFLFAFV